MPSSARAQLFALGLGGLVAAAALVFACVENPSIDGSKVPKIGAPGAPASCPELCTRLRRLCGSQPFECVKTCEEEHDDVHRECVGQASSCQEALEVCENASADEDASTEEDAAAPVDAASE